VGGYGGQPGGDGWVAGSGGGQLGGDAQMGGDGVQTGYCTWVVERRRWAGRRRHVGGQWVAARGQPGDGGGQVEGGA
jgi:hypothetical protein